MVIEMRTEIAVVTIDDGDSGNITSFLITLIGLNITPTNETTSN